MLFGKNEMSLESYDDIMYDFNESMLESSAEFADINKYLLETDIMLECMDMEGEDTTSIALESVNNWKEKLKTAFNNFIKACKEFIDRIVGLLTGKFKTYDSFIRVNAAKINSNIDRMKEPYVFEDYKWLMFSGLEQLTEKTEIKIDKYANIISKSSIVQSMLNEGKGKDVIKNEMMAEINYTISTDIFSRFNFDRSFQKFNKSDPKYSDFSYALKMLKNKITNNGDNKVKCFITGSKNKTHIQDKDYVQCITNELFGRMLALNTILNGVKNVKGQYDKIYNNMIKEIESNETLTVDALNLLVDITKTTLNNTNRALHLYVDLAKESASTAYKVCVDILGKKITVEENEMEEK